MIHSNNDRKIVRLIYDTRFTAMEGSATDTSVTPLSLFSLCMTTLREIGAEIFVSSGFSSSSVGRGCTEQKPPF